MTHGNVISTRAPGLPGREYVRLDRENAGF